MSAAVATDRSRLLAGPIVAGAVGIGGFAALHFRDPHESGSWGFCPFLALTGQPCPGCGGLRAVNDLSNGDVVGAISSNAMAVVLVAATVVAWAVWTWRRAHGNDVPMIDTSSRLGTLLPAAIGVGFVVFAIFRVTPWGTWFQP